MNKFEFPVPDSELEFRESDEIDCKVNFNENSFGFYLYPNEFTRQQISLGCVGAKFLFVCATNSSIRENIYGTCSIDTISAVLGESNEFHRYVFLDYRNDKVEEPVPFIWVGFRLSDVKNNDYLLLKLNSSYEKIDFIQFNRDTYKYDVVTSVDNCENSLKLRLHG
ncbi:hypothetical protein ACOQ0N_004597 [Vibrio parahaemolyticus]|uniref:hypothetical protein n=1 Tax=Vibrio parahaemolyticus TaxID=670 RepID=UPI0006A5A4B3|nr:hypothetical protein [Vibrio parahaemolyticus]EHK9182000.1 hypothetical protein [Vibrio parahaemolyticus]KOE06997.1 hypothetical protein ACS82_00160 [Vibrio parahaemolyticus]